jgi:predicted Fe-Mo cluster-binding NifX family protein
MRIAIPMSSGQLAQHFGHCECFALFDIDPATRRIVGRTDVIPPAHEPGVLPAWLADQGAKLVLAGGMGSRALQAFAAVGIATIVGVPAAAPEAIAASYLAGEIAPGGNLCDH